MKMNSSVPLKDHSILTSLLPNESPRYPWKKKHIARGLGTFSRPSDRGVSTSVCCVLSYQNINTFCRTAKVIMMITRAAIFLNYGEQFHYYILSFIITFYHSVKYSSLRSRKAHKDYVVRPGERSMQ